MTLSDVFEVYSKNDIDTMVMTPLAQNTKDLVQRSVNVMSYKCTDGQYVQGDGIHDDTTGIQSAINDVKNLGGVIFFPLGKYKITSTIRIQNSVRLIGIKGRDMNNASAIIFYGTGTAIDVWADAGGGVPTEFWGFYMEGLTIYQNFDTSIGYGTTNVGLSLKKPSECYFKDIQISGFLIGLECLGLSIADFDKCYFNYNTYGVWLGRKDITKVIDVASNNMVTFNSSNFWSNKEAHVLLADCENIFFNNTHMEMSPIGFLLDCDYSSTGLVSYVRNFHIKNVNFRVNKKEVTRFTEPRFIKVNSSSGQYQLISQSSLENAEIFFNPSTYSGDMGNLPAYAVEVDTTNANNSIKFSVSNFVVFGVNTSFAYGTSIARFNLGLYKDYVVKQNSDGSGANMPLMTGGSLPQGFIFNGNQIQCLGTMNLGTESTGGPTERDFWYAFSYLKFQDATGTRYIQHILTGASSARPTNTVPDGWQFLDTTLGKPIWKLSTATTKWVDATGTSV